MKRTSSVRNAMLLALVATSMTAAMADVVTGYEAGSGYAVGVLTGQPAGPPSWYNPVAGSNEWEVVTYAGNTYGIGANPQGGGAQLITGLSLGTAYGRCQINNTYVDGTTYIVTYDIWAMYTGSPTAVPTSNVGSFSLQPSATSQLFIDLFFYPEDPVPPAGALVARGLQIYDTAPAPPDPPGVFTYYYPTALSGNMAQAKWYRSSTIWKFDGLLSRPLKTLMIDLTTGESFGIQAGDTWTLQNVALPLPTAMRFFAGGLEPGNRLAIDNLELVTYNNKTYAEDFAIVGGIPAGGNTTFALKSATGSGFGIICDEFDPNATFEMLTTSPYDTPSAITFTMTSKSSRTDISELVKVWDWTAAGGTGAYAPVPIIARAPTTSFTTASGSYSGTLSNYIRPADGAMIVEVSQTPSTEQDGFDGWSGEFRGISWTFTP